MISVCDKYEFCSRCGALTHHYYKRYCLVLCINCIDDLCDEYFTLKYKKFTKSDYDTFREFLENE